LRDTRSGPPIYRAQLSRRAKRSVEQHRQLDPAVLDFAFTFLGAGDRPAAGLAAPAVSPGADDITLSEPPELMAG